MTLGQDLRYAARIYRRRALATTLALTALSLAIGATTGVFSVVNALLLRALPFREPQRLVQLAKFDYLAIEVSERSTFYHWRDRAPYWQDAAAYRSAELNLSRSGQAVRVNVARTTAGFFAALGTEPEIGRSFAPDEDVPGKDAVAVIGYGAWQQLFGGDPRVLGATVRINGTPLAVIGVAPPGFDYPEKTAIWAPTYFDHDRLQHHNADSTTGAFGRLKPGASLAQADAIYQAELRHAYPNAFQLDPAWRPRLISLQDQLAGPVRQASLVLLAVVAFVLLIACANVAHLLLSLITERIPELAIRSALGAGRARLVRQLITESIALTLVAATAGLAVAQWACRLAAMVQPPALLSTQRYTVLDWRVLGFAAALALLTGVVFGVVPAFLAGRLDRMRGLLLAVQTALAVILVAGSVSMGRGFLKLAGTDLGLRTRNVATLSVNLEGTRAQPDAQTAQYYRRALDRLRAVPGVESAGAADYLPLVSTAAYSFQPVLDSGEKVWGVALNITPGYFQATGTGLVAGRDFTEGDRGGGARVAIVNEEYVRNAHAGAGIVGHKMIFDPPDDQPVTIVGIVRNTRFNPASGIESLFYFPVAQTKNSFATFVVRVRGNPKSYLPALRHAIQQVDSQVPVYEVETLDQRLRDKLARPRFYTTAMLFFSGFACLLAIIGAYGAASYSIARRTHEIGVRIAVGAPILGLRGMLLRQCMLPVAVGMLGGVAGAGALGRFLQHLIAGIQPTGAAICAAAALTSAITAATAVWNATGRIVRMDPTAALRAE